MSLYTIAAEYPVYDNRDALCGYRTIRHPYACCTEAYARNLAQMVANSEATATIYRDGQEMPADQLFSQPVYSGEIPW